MTLRNLSPFLMLGKILSFKYQTFSLEGAQYGLQQITSRSQKELSVGYL